MAELGYQLKTESKLRNSSDVQLEALQAIREAGNKSGIVVLPCGTGKTSVFLQTALEAGRKVLFLCYEKQGVIQVAETIREHATLLDNHLCVYTSDIKKEPNRLMCYMVTTYGMFSSPGTNRSQLTKGVKDFVLKKAKWDLVVLDETHHAAATTYMPFVKQLQQNSTRMLGFTGTLCRNDPTCKAETGTALNAGARTTLMEQHFSFIGPVLYSRTCLELEQEGLIAKVRRMEIRTELTPNFKAAAQIVTNPSTRKYVESLHPEKLNALWMLVLMHVKMGDVGMIFVNHLLHAKVVQELLGSKWQILSGSNAHGDDGKHTAEANAEIVARFNRGQLRGIVSTPVGESALDAVNPDFKYAIVIDAHSGPASASQKLGRLSRTKRLPPIKDETSDAYLQRRLAAQKKAAYYEILTLDTEEMTAAANRNVQFTHEGYALTSKTYAEVVDLYEAFVDKSELPENETVLPYVSETSQAQLLLGALRYTDLGVAAKTGAGHARAHKKEHQQHVKLADKKSKEAKHALFRDRHRAEHTRLQKKSSAVSKKAKEICKTTISSAPVSTTVLAVLRQIGIRPEVLSSLEGFIQEEEEGKDEQEAVVPDADAQKNGESDDDDEQPANQPVSSADEDDADGKALPVRLSNFQHLYPSDDDGDASS